jgi:hypothetical protein
MSEEERQGDVEGELSAEAEEQARRLFHKQKLNMKAAARETLTLTDADIMVLKSQARRPESELLAPARLGGGIVLRNNDPTDSALASDRDPTDPIRITDMDPTDPLEQAAL